MRLNSSAKISQWNRAKRIELNYSLVIPLHGPVSFRQVVFGDFRMWVIDDDIRRRSGSIM